MKTLDEIRKDINILKDQIFCQEIGNDTYYLSPTYHEQLLKLEALEHEADVLCGKSLAVILDFDTYPPSKRKMLKKISEANGTNFDCNYKDLKLEDLKTIIKINKKNNKN